MRKLSALRKIMVLLAPQIILK